MKTDPSTVLRRTDIIIADRFTFTTCTRQLPLIELKCVLPQFRNHMAGKKQKREDTPHNIGTAQDASSENHN